MIYTNPYSRLQPVNMFGAIQEAKQAKDLEQQRQNTLAEQARAAARKGQEDIVYKGQLATQALIGFKKLSAQQKPAQWNSYRQRIESLIPEAKGSLPSVWDSNDPANEAELDKLIGGWSSTFFQPEQVKLGAEETLLQVQPGVAPVEIASGKGKAGKGFQIQSIVVGDTLIETPVNILPSGNILRGPFVYDQFDESNAMPKEEYFKLYPSERPVDVRPESQSKPKPTTQAVPSPTNRAGETNQGFPIDMSMAAPGQPTNALAAMNMPTGGMAPPAAPVAPPVNAMAVPFAGGMGMALPVDIQQVTQAANMLAQEQDQFMPPNQFAQLRPAGSVPNRFGSPGVEGMEFAATGGAEPKIVGGRVVYTAKPKPEAAKDRFRPATPQEMISVGLNPEIDAAQYNETTNQVVPIQKGNVEQKLLSQVQLLEAQSAQGKSAAERDKARADAALARDSLDKIRAAKTSALRNIISLEDKVFGFVGKEFADTGPVDQLLKLTGLPTGKQQRLLDDATQTAYNSIQTAVRIAGTGDMNRTEVEFAIGMFPNSGVDLQTNIDRVASLRDRFMDYVGVQAIVRTPADFDKLPVGTIFFDAKTGKKAKKVKM